MIVGTAYVKVPVLSRNLSWLFVISWLHTFSSVLVIETGPAALTWLCPPSLQELQEYGMQAGDAHVWRVVGGGDKGGIIARVGEDVRTADLAEERLATGALLTELAQLGDRLHFRKLCGSGPAEGWVSLRLQSGKALVERVPALWCVVSASGVLVRTGSSTSEEVAGRLLMGSFLEEEQVVLEGTRLQYRLRLGQGPATGWVSIALQQKDPTMMH